MFVDCDAPSRHSGITGGLPRGVSVSRAGESRFADDREQERPYQLFLLGSAAQLSGGFGGNDRMLSSPKTEAIAAVSMLPDPVFRIGFDVHAER